MYVEDVNGLLNEAQHAFGHYYRALLETLTGCSVILQPAALLPELKLPFRARRPAGEATTELPAATKEQQTQSLFGQAC
jgi:hypothetical protein